ncbi:MAG: alpha/beta hydrolase [Phormidesmis sp.]
MTMATKTRQQAAKALFFSCKQMLGNACSRRPYGFGWGFGWGFGIGLVQIAIALSPQQAKPSYAAERVTFSLGATIERTISVESLEIYAEEGRITDELAPYLPYIEAVDPNALAAARGLLSRRIDVDVTTVSQFLYTLQGEYVLGEVGKIFRTGARLPGGKGIRGAAILSAADDEGGLTLLNVIKRFPTPTLRVDLRQGLAISNQASESLQETIAAVDLVEQISLQTLTDEFPDGQSFATLDQLVDQTGPFRIQRITMQVKASSAPIDLYLPQSPASLSSDAIAPIALDLPKTPNIASLNDRSDDRTDNRTVPTVVISHGFGNERSTYRYLANFLASHGFAVINVEHPGSSVAQFDALVSGRTSQVVPDNEFIRRPELISQVLSELEARQSTDKTFAQIDFNNVGIIGQSFGGYTALAIAGAPINFASLRANCPPPEVSLNLVVLLQCQAANLAAPNIDALDVSDSRIRAVVAINPLTSLIFGPESLGQIEVPVMMVASSGDTIAPALPEQIRPFTWLTTPERYLLLLNGGTHFSTIPITGGETFLLPPEVIGPVPEVAQRYAQVMSLAFLSTYLKGDQRYQAVLSSGFTNRFSQPELPLSIITDLDSEQLNRQLRLAAKGDLPVMQTIEHALDDMIAQESLRSK